MAVILNEDKPLVVTLKDAPKLSVDVPGGIDYVPGYRDAEEQRRANEKERIENEKERIEYYEDLRQRVEDGEFDGTITFDELTEHQKESLKGEKGDKGDKGDSGVYVGKEEPTDDSNVWIDTDEPIDTLATTEDIRELETYLDKLTPKNTLKGQPLHITDALELDTFENKIDGNSYQETTSGKNLLNINGDLYSLKAYPTVIENNKVYVTTASNSGNTISSLLDYIPVEENESYIYTMKAVQGKVRYGFSLYDEDKKVIKNSAIVTGYTYLSAYEGYYSDTLKTFTIPSGYGIKYIRPIIFAMSNTSTPNVYEELMIRRASVTDDTYEPYTNGATPNPDFPQEIEVIEGNIGIEVNGKNLFDNTFNNLGMYQTGTGQIGNFASGSSYLGAYCKVEAGKTYSISRNKLTSRFAVGVTKEIPSANTECLAITRKDSAYKLENITIPNDYCYIVLYLSNSGETSTGLDLQIEESPTATEYEPFKEQIVPLDLKGNFIGKIGDIKDYLVTDKKMYWLVKNVGKVVLNGSEGWSLQSINSYDIANFLFNHRLNGINDKITISSHFIQKQIAIANTTNECMYWQNNAVYIRMNKTTASTVEAFKQWLSTHNVTVYYQLATPEIIELGGLPETIKTFEGVNNIQVLANLPTEIEVKYALDIKKYVNGTLEEVENGSY